MERKKRLAGEGGRSQAATGNRPGEGRDQEPDPDVERWSSLQVCRGGWKHQDKPGVLTSKL